MPDGSILRMANKKGRVFLWFGKLWGSFSPQIVGKTNHHKLQTAPPTSQPSCFSESKLQGTNSMYIPIYKFPPWISCGDSIFVKTRKWTHQKKHRETCIFSKNNTQGFPKNIAASLDMKMFKWYLGKLLHWFIFLQGFLWKYVFASGSSVLA